MPATLTADEDAFRYHAAHRFRAAARRDSGRMADLEGMGLDRYRTGMSTDSARGPETTGSNRLISDNTDTESGQPQPAAWHAEHLAPLAGLAPEQMLRRAAALRRARACTAAAYPQLGEVLGIPPGSAKSTVKAVSRRLEAAGRQAQFEAAIDALAAMLDTTVSRTDYDSRRSTLRS